MCPTPVRDSARVHTAKATGCCLVSTVAFCLFFAQLVVLLVALYSP
jgi:hypothetical protein